MRVELLSGLLRHRRAVVLGALATVTAAAWAYLLLGAGIDMELMDKDGGQMMAMMLPTAAPTVLLVTALAWIAPRTPTLFLPCRRGKPDYHVEGIG